MVRQRMTGKERREQLISIGRAVFAERGFEGTSVEEIAQRASVSKPVVYEHFGGKEGLYAVVVDREMLALEKVITDALSHGRSRVRIEQAVIALLKGIAKAVLELGLEAPDFIAAHTTGFDTFRADIEALTWVEVTTACGVTREEIEHIARRYGQAERVVFAWGMGMTHHIHGVANVEAIANLAMLRGMVGKRHAGLLPLRGHSNVQGIGTIGVKPVLARDVLARMEAEFGVKFPEEKGFDTMACLKAAEAAEIEGCTIATMYWRIHKARKLLHRRLKDYLSP